VRISDKQQKYSSLAEVKIKLEIWNTLPEMDLDFNDYSVISTEAMKYVETHFKE
jgi:hypothetical protein